MPRVSSSRTCRGQVIATKPSGLPQHTPRHRTARRSIHAPASRPTRSFSANAARPAPAASASWAGGILGTPIGRNGAGRDLDRATIRRGGLKIGRHLAGLHGQGLELARGSAAWPVPRRRAERRRHLKRAHGPSIEEPKTSRFKASDGFAVHRCGCGVSRESVEAQATTRHRSAWSCNS